MPLPQSSVALAQAIQSKRPSRRKTDRSKEDWVAPEGWGHPGLALRQRVAGAYIRTCVAARLPHAPKASPPMTDSSASHVAPVFATRLPAAALSWGTAACAAALLLAGGLTASGQRPPSPGTGGPLVVSTSPLPDARQMVVVVDPGTRHAAVYMVDQEGMLVLKSARDLTWDLMVGEFNAQEPKPAAMRKLLETVQPPR
jgi:hypothetical protein